MQQTKSAKRRGRKAGKTNMGNQGQSMISSVPAAYDVMLASRNTRARPYVTEPGRVLLADVAGSTTFSATKYNLNPGLTEVFGSRLANIATGYEKYCWEVDLRVVYTASNAVSTTAGVLWLAADYDPTDAVPADETALSTFETWVQGMVRAPKLELRISKDRSFDGVQHKLVRSGPVAGDLSLYDACSLIVATDDCASSADIGKIYLEYQFRFVSPQTNPTSFVPPNMCIYNLSANQTFTTTVAAALNFDEPVVEGFTITNNAGVYTLPPGAYVVHVDHTYQDSAAETFKVETTFQVNGAEPVPPQRDNFRNTVVSQCLTQLSSDFWASSSSSFTISIVITCTGAAGTLTALQDQCRLRIMAVG